MQENDVLKRPASVTIIGWLFIVTGVVGVAYHASEFSLQRPFANDAVWVTGVRLSAILFGVFVLRGNSWARWGILAWLGYHVILSIWHTPLEIVMHGALLIVIGLVLFRPTASRYFSRSAVGLLLCLSSFGTASAAQQVADTSFTPPIVSPEYPRGQGPLVLIDAAHHNFHTADGRYLSFARLLRRDGYVVESNTEIFSAASLDRAAVLVISNAMHEQSATGFAPLPNHSAFSDAEITAVEAWVRTGGSLMLIADHMPIAGHAEALAAAFGLRFQNGFAFESGGGGRATFRRTDGSLVVSGVVDGRGALERVDSVTTFTGQAFRIDPNVDAEPLLILPEGFVLLLPEVAWQFSESTPRIPAAYLLQGALVRHGQGRVAVFGEAAMFSAQLGGPQRTPMGMNDPAAGQNYLFALNVMHWLSGRLP